MTIERRRKDQLKAKLREADPTYRYYKSIFHLTGDMIALSEGYHIIDANKTFSDFFALSGIDVFGEDFRLSEQFLKIDKYGYVYEGYLNHPWYQTVLHKEKEHYKVGISGPDKIYTFTISVTALDEEVYVITLSDVSDMMSYKCRLEEEIRVSTDEKEAAKYILQQFNQAIDESNLVSRCNLDGIITYVNDALCIALGYTREELLGNSMAVLFACDLEITCTTAALEAIEQGIRWKGIAKNRGKSGEIHYFATTIVPIKNFADEVIEILSIRHDITEMVKAKEEALESLHAKSRFFDQVSHELRTPLNAIVNFTDQALEEFDTVAEDEVSRSLVKKYLQRTYANAENLLELINLLLDVAKMRSGNTVFEMKNHNAVALAKEAFENCSSLVKPSGVDYRFKAQNSLIEIKCDGVKFKQIITNLISNALKFTTQGFVEIRLEIDGEGCLVSVEDTGIGIPQEQFGLIFEPFAQVRDHGFGTGLGLNIVREYAKSMGMTLEVRSREGEGSCFTLKTSLVPIVEHSDAKE
jgi:PAS domain S-box-containing protein